MASEEKYKERQKWFTDRVGKKIYRNKNTCICVVCESVYQNGLFLSDKQHAMYVMDCESESWADGETGIRYFDTKEEVIEFERSIKL